MDDQEKLSLRKQVEILNLQKDVLSRQISKLRDDIAAEKTEFQKTQNKLLDEIRVKDIEIRAVRNYMEKHSAEIKNQLKDEFHALEMEKERIAEVTKELDAKRDMLENLVAAKQAGFEKQLRMEKELFDKSREEYTKNTKKLQAALDERTHKEASGIKELEEEIKSLRREMLDKDKLLAESERREGALLTAAADKDSRIEDMKKGAASIEDLKKEIELLADNKEKLSRALDETNNLLIASNENAETFKKSAAQIKAAMFDREKEISEQIRQQKETTSELSAEIDSLKKENKKLPEMQKIVEVLEKEKTALSEKISSLSGRSKENDKTADALLAAIQKNDKLQKLNDLLEKKLKKQESAPDMKQKKSGVSSKARGSSKFKCSECGAIVSAHDKQCPSCGESFE